MCSFQSYLTGLFRVDFNCLKIKFFSPKPCAEKIKKSSIFSGK
jgi:hypothetical protein